MGVENHRDGLVENFFDRVKRHKVVVVLAVFVAFIGSVAGLVGDVELILERLVALSSTEKDKARERMSSMVDGVLNGQWESRCVFQVPAGWNVLHDGANSNTSISPALGTLMDKARVSLSVSSSGGYVAESEFYGREGSEEKLEKRGFILTHSDQKEALGQSSDGVYNGSVLERRMLRFKVLYEDGIGIQQEEVEVVRTADNGLVVQAMVRPTDISDLYSEEGSKAAHGFVGYKDFQCVGRADFGVKPIVDMCMALIERTLVNTTFGAHAIDCENNP